jgi:hypothetical protein
MNKYPLPPHDVDGRRIRLGSRVRVIGVPDLSGMLSSVRGETTAVFQHIRGTYKRVERFDQYGCAEISFSIRRGKHRGMHWVAIEPNLLRVVGNRSTRAQSSKARSKALRMTRDA